MPQVKLLDVGDSLIDKLWEIVSQSGSFYSIGDGSSRKRLRDVLLSSSFVLEYSGSIVRLNVGEDYVELHPIVLGHSTIRDAPNAIKAIYNKLGIIFSPKPIRCTIPVELRSAHRLAERANMTFTGETQGMLSNVEVLCDVYEWRP